MQNISPQKFDRELKKGGAELLVLSLLEARPRHGYEVRKMIDARSDGALKFNAASLYLLLYRLEKRGWIEGSSRGESRATAAALLQIDERRQEGVGRATQHLGVIRGRHQSRNETGKCLTGNLRSDGG
jgi:DNA-binding PadR family transcriptional regulator